MVPLRYCDFPETKERLGLYINGKNIHTTVKNPFIENYILYLPIKLILDEIQIIYKVNIDIYEDSIEFELGKKKFTVREGSTLVENGEKSEVLLYSMRKIENEYFVPANFFEEETNISVAIEETGNIYVASSVLYDGYLYIGELLRIENKPLMSYVFVDGEVIDKVDSGSSHLIYIKPSVLNMQDESDSLPLDKIRILGQWDSCEKGMKYRFCCSYLDNPVSYHLMELGELNNNYRIGNIIYTNESWQSFQNGRVSMFGGYTEFVNIRCSDHFLNKELLLKMFQEHRESIEDKVVFNRLLLDIFYDDVQSVTLFMNAYNLDIVEKIKKSKLSDYFVEKIVREIVKQYGTQTELTNRAVIAWIENYGEAILGKIYCGIRKYEAPYRKIIKKREMFWEQDIFSENREYRGINYIIPERFKFYSNASGVYYYPYEDSNLGVIYLKVQDNPANKESFDVISFANGLYRGSNNLISLSNTEFNSRTWARINYYESTGSYECVSYVYATDDCIYSVNFGEKYAFCSNMQKFQNRFMSDLKVVDYDDAEIIDMKKGVCCESILSVSRETEDMMSELANDVKTDLDVNVIIDGRIKDAKLTVSENGFQIVFRNGKKEDYEINIKDYTISNEMVKTGILFRKNIECCVLQCQDKKIILKNEGNIEEELCETRRQIIHNCMIREKHSAMLIKKQRDLFQSLQIEKKYITNIDEHKLELKSFLNNPYRVLHCSVIDNKSMVPDAYTLYDKIHTLQEDVFWKENRRWAFAHIPEPELSLLAIKKAKYEVYKNYEHNIFWVDSERCLLEWENAFDFDLSTYDEFIAYYFKLLLEGCSLANDRWKKWFAVLGRLTCKSEKELFDKYVGTRMISSHNSSEKSITFLINILQPIIDKIYDFREDMYAFAELLRDEDILLDEEFKIKLMDVLVKKTQSLLRDCVRYDEGVEKYEKTMRILNEAAINISSNSFRNFLDEELSWLITITNNKKDIMQYVNIVYNFPGNPWIRKEWREKFGKFIFDTPMNELNIDEIIELASWFHRKKEYKMSFIYYEEGARRENTICNLYIGIYYFEGLGQEKNYIKAHSYFSKARDAGSVEAINYMALLYQKSGKRSHFYDIKTLEALYKEAISKGSIDALYNYAQFLKTQSFELYKDKKIVFDYMKQAADKGLTKAKRFIKKYFSNFKNIDDVKTICFQDVVIVSNSMKCTNLNHSVSSINALIYKIRRDGSIVSVNVPAAYCFDCCKYFILRKDIE